MKVHLSLATRDLDGSVAFYRTLLGAEPVKHLDDYALFLSDDPGLELALDRDPEAAPRDDAHFGIVVDAADVVDAAAGRLAAAGFAADLTRDETCCYARSTKVWSTDPDGRRWETYVVHAETAERDGEPAAACC